MSTWLVIFAVGVSAIDLGAADAQTKRYAGRPVADVLKELESPDLQFIFSNELVPVRLRVKSEPPGPAPSDIARQILAEHNLALEPGPRGRLIVVVARPRPGTKRTAKPDDPATPPMTPTPAFSPETLRVEEWVTVTDKLNNAGARTAVYVVDPLKVRETAGNFGDLFHSLKLLPPVTPVNDDDGRISVRGTGPEHNMVVVDGVQIHNPYRLGELTAGFLNPATAASVRLDASGLEARHGGRLSSVTVIDTRDGVADRALAVSGSVSLVAGDILLEGRLPGSDSGSWWTTARGTYYRPLFNRVASDAMPGFADVQSKLSLRPSSRTRLTLFAMAGREMSVENEHNSDIGDMGRPGVTHPIVIGGARYQGLNRLAVMNLWWTPGSRLSSTTTASAYAHDTREFDGSLSFLGQPFERDVAVRDLAIRQRFVFAPSPNQLLDAGVELHGLDSHWRMQDVKPQNLPRGLGPSTWGELVDYTHGPISTSLSRTQVGAWLQPRFTIGSSLTVDPGIRVEWNSFTGESSWQPRLRVSTRVRSAIVWAGAALQAQTPSHEGLQGFDYVHLTQTEGARLRNERSLQYVAGIEQTFGEGVAVRVEVYRRRLDRLLAQRLETDGERAQRLSAFVIPADLPADSVILEHRPTMTAESTGVGSSSGVELQLERSRGRLTGILAYAFSRSTRDVYGFTFPFDFDRPHAVKLMAFYQVSRRLRASATWQHASGLPITPLHEEVRFFNPIAPDGTVDPIARAARRQDGTLAMTLTPSLRRLTLRNTDRLDGYDRADIRATWSTLGHWQFYGEILNVFNHRNFIHQIQVPPSVAGNDGFVTKNNEYRYFERLISFGIRATF